LRRNSGRTHGVASKLDAEQGEIRREYGTKEWKGKTKNYGLDD
jgi:hypothetical protein